MFWIILIVLVLLLPSILFIVRGKTAAILETFGRPHKAAVFPGLHAKLPWPITIVVARVNLQIQEIHADVSVKTSDNAFMTLPVKVQYRASDDPVGAVKAHYELEAPERQITSYVLNNVRQTASGMEMTDLYANRDNVEQQVQVALSEQFARFGYIIENVLVDEPQPSPEVRDAFNQVIASKRLMEAARNEAEAQRIKLVGAAQAEAESKKLQGEGMAQMREAIARGLEEAMRTMTSAGLSTEQSIQFLSDTNRLDTITSAATHGNTIIIDAGANKELAGMAAMLESVQQKTK
ncbi:MAG: SPFH domain-containing protein [Candidatus Pacebacteria bacterium]|nr:SPFH domain-containing protein [Candidatus Paceibacterota bacterium]